MSNRDEAAYGKNGMKFTVPATILEQHVAVLGKTGSGKSYAVRGLVEGLLDESARVCMQRMRAKQLWTEPARGQVRASEDLF